MQLKRSDSPTNVIDFEPHFWNALSGRALEHVVKSIAEPERWWSAGRFKTKPSWYVGHPFLGVSEIEHDVRNADDWAWLTQQIHQLRAMYEARVGHALPEKDTPAWCEDADDEFES